MMLVDVMQYLLRHSELTARGQEPKSQIAQTIILGEKRKGKKKQNKQNQPNKKT